MTLKPILQALLVADHVYEDRQTGKKVVAGIFHRLLFVPPGQAKAAAEAAGVTGKQKLSAIATQRAGSPYAYVSLTSVRGKQPFELRYVSLEDEKVHFKLQFEITWNDPLKPVEIVVPLPSLPTPRPGAFALELLCNDEPIGSFRISVEPLWIEGQ